MSNRTVYSTESFPTAPRRARGATIVALGAATIHAAVQEGAANNSFTAIVQPDVPRLLSATFAAGWQGGDIFITGWDANNEYVTETIPDTAGATINGTQVFARINTITKELVAGTTDTVTIGTQAANYYSTPFATLSQGFDYYWETTGTITSTVTLWVARVARPNRNNDTDWAPVTPAATAPTAAGAAINGVSQNPTAVGGLYRWKYAAPTGAGTIFGEVNLARR